MNYLVVLLMILSWLPMRGWLGNHLLGGDLEPLLCLAGLVVLRTRNRGLDLRLCAGLLAVRVTTQAWLPEAAQAVLTALATASFLASWARQRLLDPGLTVLMLLGLPCLASAQFYLGYPLRTLTTMGAVVLLNLDGQCVRWEGTLIRQGPQLISVDTPCSGLKMLWAGLVLVSLLAWVRRWPRSATLRMQVNTVLALLAANCVRVACLVLHKYAEGGAHELVGLFFFGAALILVLRGCPAQPGPDLVASGQRRGLALFLPVALLACLPVARLQARYEAPFPGWWKEYQGRPLVRLPLSPDEQRFYANFPGQAARFSQGDRVVVLRFVTSKTRRLHPSSECYLASGWDIGDWNYLPDGPWSSFRAHKDTAYLTVREHIEGPERVFTDVSQWYWSADKGPWWCVTEIYKL